jgi:putative ABC transport system permease protein
VQEATTWYAIPAGGVQGDIAVVPKAVVVDYATFARTILPQLRRAFGNSTAINNPGLSELPAATVEAHVQVDHGAYPADPARAATWSGAMKRILERRAPGDVIVADNTFEPLSEASSDATNAKTLFLLLGIPGAIVAAALGLAAASALAESQRREDALLRLRGATDTQLVRLAVGNGIVASGAGIVVGLVVAGIGTSAVIGHPVWRDIGTVDLIVAVLLSVAAGAITTAARLVPLVRGRRSTLTVERRALSTPWTPRWRQGRYDVVALGVGLSILAINVAAGGLKPLPVEGAAVALSFYALLAPMALWVAVALLAIRALLVLLDRWSRPVRPRPLTTWRATALRWLGRRPARPAVALLLGILAVSFGAEVVSFVATYRTAKHNDTRAAFGSDLRLTPTTDPVPPLPALGSDVTAITPVRFVPARAGSDRKTILAVDAATYAATATSSPQITSGRGLDALASTRSAVIVSDEVARDYAVSPGDTLPITIFPDDKDLSTQINLHVVGVARAFPPSDPFAEMVMSVRDIPIPRPAPDFYLAHTQHGRTPDSVARDLRARRDLGGFSVSTISELARKQQRTLTALNLGGLGRIEAIASGLIASVGIGVLGAFTILERQRELALLRSLGASNRQLRTAPLLEGALATVGSLVIGIPLGLFLNVLAVRVLGLFFTLPPPLLTVPVVELAALAGSVLILSAVALGLALRRVGRVEVALLLREP